MYLAPECFRFSGWRNSLNQALLAATLFLPALLSGQTNARSGDASLSGNVSNAATGNMLEGATVELPQLGRSVLTDNTGRYVFANLPAGTYKVIATYAGLDPMEFSALVPAGGRASRDFELTTRIYQLQAYTVSSEREGTAAAVTAQRNAPNVKNVVAIDAYGTLPNMSASELAVLLPGVAGELSEEGNIVGFTIRGMPPGMNTITIDGALMSSQGGISRTTRIHTLTGAMFDQLELTKGHTPDKGADSLGGTINLKSRSTLSMREKRRISYDFAARWAPPFTEQNTLREQHRVHPVLNVAYQEVFGILGGQRNLGVSVNMFYSEQVTGQYNTQRDIQDTPTGPAFLFDYRTTESYNNRKQASVNAKVDYRLSESTVLTFNTIYNDAMTKDQRAYQVRAFTNQTVGTSGNAGILPGYTDKITQIRQSTASTIDVTLNGPTVFLNRLRHFDFGGEHQFPRFNIDYKAIYSQTHINSGHNGEAGTLAHRLTNVGWILDRTESNIFPRFTQTAGVDISDPANYRPTGQLTNNNTGEDHEAREIAGNVRYNIPSEAKIALKTGFKWRAQRAANSRDNRRWNYLGTTHLPANSDMVGVGARETGLVVPFWETATLLKAREPVNPALWREDLYFREQQRYLFDRAVTEKVTAAYIMAQGRLNRTSVLGGVRTEWTDVASRGFVRSRVPSSGQEQLLDPVGAAQRDYGNNRRELDGQHSRSFPSVHVVHDITPDLKARASWSTSFGRPPMTQLLPNESVNEGNHTLTINNPNLKPQTATNWDAALEYYFKQIGSISAGWFHKKIKDYIVTGVDFGVVGTGGDNGYGGEYASYDIRGATNLGTATVQGWEFAYQQQLTFLPGPLSGLSISSNLTLTDTHGDYGENTQRSNKQVEGFYPYTGNVTLRWRYRAFSTQIITNRTSEVLTAFTSGKPHRDLYRAKRTTVNAGIAYQLRPELSLTCDVQNLTNEPQMIFRGTPETFQLYRTTGTTLVFGVRGRF